jgi:glycerophosphoryl diester phosphodiesterase
LTTSHTDRKSCSRCRLHTLIAATGAILFFYLILRFLVPGNPASQAALDYQGAEVIAHRGGSSLWPENTLYAFENATELGVDALEMDVRTTADGMLVLLHDANVDRTTEGTGPVRQYTLEELRLLDAGFDWTANGAEDYPFRGQGITIPTLGEVFTALPQMEMIVEIKEKDLGSSEILCETIRQHDMVHAVTVASIHPRVLRHFRSVCPEVTSAAAFTEVLSFFLLDRVGLAHFYPIPAEIVAIPQSWPAPVLRLEIPVADARFITTSHEQGKRVRVWTVNDVARMRHYLNLKADGIITDHPDKLLDEIEIGARR